MRNLSRPLVAIVGLVVLCAPAPADEPKQPEAAARWSKEKANAWYARQPWLVGCNFIPSSAVNQLEMWQQDTFDPKTIDRELGWAADRLGFNTARVFLHDLAWQADPAGFKERVRTYLAIAERHKIRTLFVLFDDVWNPEPKVGKQPAPRPGVHNSQWVRSPGPRVVNDPKQWGRLEKYVIDMLTTFGKDERILGWDLYNEPGNEGQVNKSMPLLKQTFVWARRAHPTQPLTVGLWRYDKAFKELNDAQLAASDVISFHHYGKANEVRRLIGDLKKHGRPLLCTEYMARTQGSRFATHLPVFKDEKVGCYNWGLVSGKTQTIYPWGSKAGAPEPKVWFHDVFRADGTPFDAKEVEAIRAATRGR